MGVPTMGQNRDDADHKETEQGKVSDDVEPR
jgi:hypothetical protein